LRRKVWNIVVDRHRFSNEIATLLLDKDMVAMQEVATNFNDRLGGGEGDVIGDFVEKTGQNSDNTTFNLARVITVGRKAYKVRGLEKRKYDSSRFRLKRIIFTVLILYAWNFFDLCKLYALLIAQYTS
jgi:hypothetical protein